VLAYNLEIFLEEKIMNKVIQLIELFKDLQKEYEISGGLDLEKYELASNMVRTNQISVALVDYNLETPVFSDRIVLPETELTMSIIELSSKKCLSFSIAYLADKYRFFIPNEPSQLLTGDIRFVGSDFESSTDLRVVTHIDLEIF
jgi:hypothetical protein